MPLFSFVRQSQGCRLRHRRSVARDEDDIQKSALSGYFKSVPRAADLEATAETDKNVEVVGALSQPKERIDVDREIRRHLINQTGIQRTDPRMVFAGTDRVVEFNITAQFASDCARNTDRVVPLDASIVAARLIENVDPGLPKQCETAGQTVVERQAEAGLVDAVPEVIAISRDLERGNQAEHEFTAVVADEIDLESDGRVAKAILLQRRAEIVSAGATIDIHLRKDLEIHPVR